MKRRHRETGACLDREKLNFVCLTNWMLVTQNI